MPITRNTKAVSDRELAALFSVFERYTKVVEGGLQYSNFEFNDIFEVLPDAFTVRPSISRSEAIDLFRNALRHCRRNGAITPEKVTTKAEELHRQNMAVSQCQFTMWTKFRAQQMAFSRGFRLKWRGVSARTASSLPPWLNIDEYFMGGVGRIYPSEPHFYGYIILNCNDRNEDRAVDRMMDSLQLIYGLLNLFETWGRVSFWHGRNWTEGAVWLGPNQFLFRERISRGEDRLWYNPEFHLEAWERQPPQMKRIIQIVPFVRKALTVLDQHPFSEPLIKSIMLLQDGFSERDGNRRLLRYWSALEQLYVEANDKHRSNEKVIERALFLESEPDLSKWKLRHIAQLRNDYVHAGGQGDDHHALGQFLRGLVAGHIHYWIFHGKELSSHASMLAFAHLSSDRAYLVRTRDTIDRRIQLIDEMSERVNDVE